MDSTEGSGPTPRGDADRPAAFDVFISYPHADRPGVAVMAQALRDLGLAVWIDDSGVEAFDRIHDRVVEGLAASRVCLAWYSRHYPASRACQWELATAWRCEDGARILVVNPEATDAHVQPRSLLHRAYLRAGDATDAARQVQRALAAFPTPIGASAAMPSPLQHGRQFSGSNRFVGRSRELWAVHDALTSARATMLTGIECPVVQLRGFGGVGKSLLAEEYALRFGASYPGGIFWLKAYGHDEAGRAMTAADRAAERHRQLADFASRLQIPVAGRPPAEIRAALGQVLGTGRRSLWIVDDMPAGGSAEDFGEWLSPHAAVPTLVTSRDGTYSSIGVVVVVDALADEDALRLFESHRPSGAGERESVVELLAALGGHALAIEVAASYLDGQPGSAIAEFVEELRHPDADVLEQAATLADALPLAHSPSIVATLSGTIARLGPHARDLLYLAACVAAAPLPAPLVESIFARLFGAREARFLRVAAVKETERFGLSRREARDTDASSVHTLVARTAARHPAAGARLAEVRAAALAVLGDTLAQMLSPGVIVRNALAITHAQAIAAPLGNADESALLVRVANTHLQRGDLASAERLAQRALAHDEAAFGPDVLSTCCARSGVAMVLLARGDTAAAQCIFDRVMPVLEAELPAGHVYRIGAQIGSAQIAAAGGDLAGAIARVEGSLAECVAANGPDHRMTMNVRTLLAQLHFARADAVQARRVWQDVLDAHRRIADTADLDALVDEFALAQWSAGNGDAEPFAPVIEKAVRVFSQSFGDDSLLTLAAQLMLLTLHASRSELTAARAVAVDLMPRYERVLGAENPATLLAQSVDAMVLLVTGEGGTARARLEAIVAKLRVLYGARHAAVLQAEVFLAAAMSDNEEFTACEALLAQILPAAQASPGGGAAMTQFALSILGDCRAGQGDLHGACRLREQVVELGIARLGADHADVLGSQVRLAQALLAAQADQRACEVACAVIAAAQPRLGIDHATTRNAMTCLGIALSRLGATETTAEAWGPLAEIANRFLPPDGEQRLMLCVAHAQALLRFGEFARCRDLADAALPHALARFGDADPTPRHLRSCLAFALQMLQAFDAASVHWEWLLEQDIARLGLADQQTIATAQALFNTRWGAGDGAACKRIFERCFAPFCDREPQQLTPLEAGIRAVLAAHTDWLRT